MKTIGTTLLLIAAIVFSSTNAWAVDKPSSDEVFKVMEYYRTGSEAILVESTLCAEIAKEGTDKNQCTSPLPNSITKGEDASVWMNFMVPGDDAANILVQFKFKGRVLSSRELKLSSAIRYRTWLNAPNNKVGNWTVSVEQEGENSYLPIGEYSYTVVDAPAQ